MATPLEIVSASGYRNRLSPEARKAFGGSTIVRQLKSEAPQPYARSVLASDVLLYSDGRAPGDKTLVIGFTGAAHRLMLPIATVLQNLPIERTDLVLLRESTRSHYDAGVAGYAATLPDLAGRLRRDLEPRRYRSLVTLGTSMGGFPALRAGLMMGADAAIAIGGRSIWHVDRLSAPNRAPITAFDPLCPCGPGETRLICVYAAKNAEDIKSADAVAAMRPVDRFAFDTADHNVLLALWRQGSLRTALSDLSAGQIPTVGLKPDSDA